MRACSPLQEFKVHPTNKTKRKRETRELAEGGGCAVSRRASDPVPHHDHGRGGEKKEEGEEENREEPDPNRNQTPTFQGGKRLAFPRSRLPTQWVFRIITRAEESLQVDHPLSRCFEKVASPLVRVEPYHN